MVATQEFDHGTTYHYSGPAADPRSSIVSLNMKVHFTNPSGGGLITGTGIKTFKLPPVSPLETNVVRDINDPRATAQAQATFTASEGFLVFSLSARLKTTIEVPPGYKITGNTYTSDPLTSVITGPGSLVTLTESLLAGTTIPAHSAAFPDLSGDLFGRYGIGSQFQPDDPETLWGVADDQGMPALAPPGAFDLFHIRIFDNAAGALTGVASGASPGSLLDVGFSRSLGQIKSAIEDTTNWSHQANGSWVLKEDLDLFDLTLTNNRSDLDSQQFTIGTFGRTSFAVIAPVPEPSSFALLSAGILGLAVYAWRRHLDHIAEKAAGQALREWETHYNYQRFSLALQGRTPAEKLAAVHPSRPAA